MKIIPALLLFCLFPIYVFSQSTNSINGNLVDSTSSNKLEYSRILILNSKDSIMLSHTKAAADGSFRINNLPYGKFLLLITYPGYADYAERFSLDSINKTHNFGKIYLNTKARILAGVIIRGRAAITIKGDTTEFNAEKFVIESNSKVEDLLRQLPGIEVDKDGRITAQGQRINKVLVDGEEFFGDDPTLVTRNIRGDMVDKIQLYDKKSDLATLTGIDDDKKTKTLNVVLKEDSKNGYFGNANAGGTTSRLYDTQSMFNAFKTKRKFAAYSNIGTTGKTGPDFSQGNRFGTVPTTVATVNGVTGFFDELEGTGRYNGRGIPTARTNGAHFDSKWNADKQSVNVNYRIGSIQTEGSDKTLSQVILPANITSIATDNAFDNYTFRQRLDINYQVSLSKTSTLRIIADGTLKDVRNTSTLSSLRTLENGLSLTRQNSLLSSKGKQKVLNSGISWIKRFKKAGRSVSLSISQSLGNTNTDAYQNTTNNFYNISGSTDSIHHINQQKISESESRALSSSLAYTEPLSKAWALRLNYGINFNNGNSIRQTFNQSGTGNYDIPDKEFSNDIDYEQTVNVAGMTLNYRKTKTSVNIGVRMNDINFHQLDRYSNKAYNRNYTNWTPLFSYQYSFSQEKSFAFRYTSNTTQPRMDQLQPQRFNDDPLNILTGNPYLKPSLNNSFSTTFSSYKPLNNRYINLTGSWSFTSNSFANSYITNTAGKTILQAVNITGRAASDISVALEMRRQLKWPSLEVSFNASSSMNNGYDIINNILNSKKYMTYSSWIMFSKYKLKKYSFNTRFNASYNNSLQSLQSLKDNNMIFNSTASFILYFPGKTEFSSDLTYTHNSGTQAFGNAVNPFIWNSRFGKKFLKAENLKFFLSVNNLLNQNPGFIRQANYQNTYTTIRRYFMGSVTWDFSNMGAKK